jgi:ABC-2 type transport system permease protein
MFALFAVTGGAATILKEKEQGTFKRLLIAPLPPSALLGGKLLAQFIQTFVQLTLLFALGIFIFKVNVGPSIPALLLLIVATSFAATGVGLILVSVVKSQAQLRPITTLVVLSFSALGGSWWPIAAEPHWMQNLAKVTLNSWAMSGFNGLMIFDKDLVRFCLTSSLCSRTGWCASRSRAAPSDFGRRENGTARDFHSISGDASLEAAIGG